MALQFHPLPLDVFNEEARPFIGRFNNEMRQIFGLEGALRQPITARRSDLSIARRAEVQVEVSRITPSIGEVVSGVSTAIGTPSITLGTSNIIGSTTTAISINSTIAFFDTTAPSALGSTAATGSAGFGARRDHQHKFPHVLMPSGGTTTLTLSGTTTHFLTGDFSSLTINTLDDTMKLPTRIGLGLEPHADTGAGFQLRTSQQGNYLRGGLEGGITVDDGGIYGSTAGFFGGILRCILSGNVGNTFTSTRLVALRIEPDSETYTTNLHSFTERVGLDIFASGVALQSGSAGVTTTDYYQIKCSTWPAIGNPGTTPNARTILVPFPTLGSTIRRAIHVSTATSNLGTEAQNTEGIYVEDLARGTSQRANYYGEGATTGTPSNVYCFLQGTAHVVGSTRVGFKSAGATTGTPTLCVGFYADAHTVGSSKYSFYGISDTAYFGGDCQIGAVLNHDGLRVGLYGATPTIVYGTTNTQSGHTAGSSTAITVDSLFTGDTGSTSYTIGDIVRLLKLIGVATA